METDGLLNYMELGEPELFQEYALAFADCAIALFPEMRDGTLQPDYLRARVAAYLVNQAQELFFTGAIAKATETFDKNHNQEQTLEGYESNFPGAEYDIQPLSFNISVEQTDLGDQTVTRKSVGNINVELRYPPRADDAVSRRFDSLHSGDYLIQMKRIRESMENSGEKNHA